MTVSHTSCDGPRGEMTRWHVDFLFCKFILVWSGNDNDLTGSETPDIRTTTTIYICNTHVYSTETNPWDMPHPGKLTRSRGFQSSKRLLVDFHHNSSMITRTVVSQTISMLVWYSAFFSSGTSIQFTLLFFLGAVVSAIQEQHRTTIYHISGYKRK